MDQFWQHNISRATAFRPTQRNPTRKTSEQNDFSTDRHPVTSKYRVLPLIVALISYCEKKLVTVASEPFLGDHL